MFLLIQESMSKFHLSAINVNSLFVLLGPHMCIWNTKYLENEYWFTGTFTWGLNGVGDTPVLWNLWSFSVIIRHFTF